MYDSASQLQRFLTLQHIDKTAEYLKRSYSLPGPLSFLEIGSSTGLNSTLAWKYLLEKHPPPTNLNLTFSDLPSNHWNSVMSNALTFKELGLSSKLAFFMAGGSYVDPLCLPSSINLSLTASTIHWLTQCEPAPDAFFPEFTKNPEVSAKNRALAQQDLEKCLRARAYELKPGGYFITTSLFESFEEHNELFMPAFNAMVSEGLITSQEFLRMNVAIFSRKLADFELALSRNPGLFEISEYLEFSAPESILPSKHDRVLFFRGFTEVVVLEAVKQSRPSEEAQAVLEAIYARLGQTDLDAKPVKTPSHYCVLRRK
jgi:hypothetical protein